MRETPEGWCVDSAALGRWFKLGVKPLTAGSVLMLESEAKLPVEMAIEREAARGANPAGGNAVGKPAQGAPALPHVAGAGAGFHRQCRGHLPGLDRHAGGPQAAVAAAGEIAHLSYDAMLSTDDKGARIRSGLRAYRSDPEGGLLGPLNATHFGVGDVAGLSSRLVRGSSGRGAVVTNRPLFNPVAFDRTRFEGDLPAGWDAELYRNGELLAFSRSDGSQRYVFDDVPMIYGDNRFEIILYGPQGQQRSRLEYLNVGQNQVPAGKTWYWAGISQPGKNLVGDLVGRDDGGGPGINWPAGGPVDRKLLISSSRISRPQCRWNMGWASGRRSACSLPCCSKAMKG